MFKNHVPYSSSIVYPLSTIYMYVDKYITIIIDMAEPTGRMSLQLKGSSNANEVARLGKLNLPDFNVRRKTTGGNVATTWRHGPVTVYHLSVEKRIVTLVIDKEPRNFSQQ